MPFTIKGFSHPWILLSIGVPETNPPEWLRDNCMCFRKSIFSQSYVSTILLMQIKKEYGTRVLFKFKLQITIMKVIYSNYMLALLIYVAGIENIDK